jgi:two-component system, cell cycle sensor histidine kinase and response regulator CckA
MGTVMTPPESILSNPGACIPVLSPDSAEPEQTQNCWETILLVEDEAFVRDVTQEVLEMCGYTVLTACDAAEGIRVFERHSGPVHLLVTDVVMPGMNGRELAGRLLLRCPNLKTIFISGYADNAVVREGAGISSAG